MLSQALKPHSLREGEKAVHSGCALALSSGPHVKGLWASKATMRCLLWLAGSSGFPLSGGESYALQTPSGDVPLLS